MKPIGVSWNQIVALVFVSGWRRDSQSCLGKEHAYDWSPQPGGSPGHALLRAGNEPPGRHGESPLTHLKPCDSTLHDISPTISQSSRSFTRPWQKDYQVFLFDNLCNAPGPWWLFCKKRDQPCNTRINSFLIMSVFPPVPHFLQGGTSFLFPSFIDKERHSWIFS